ncbi:hypothetical protein WR25_02147 [Diploscapter pachys]|uniref:Uncharacterized protein n=1 Tax=Diploscapter pachys TaxID=2018661 RepID=A0A2A2K1G1_9BILA|nr:hypothetical protein WR25_02147 [Diploscapter pachys]
MRFRPDAGLMRSPLNAISLLFHVSEPRPAELMIVAITLTANNVMSEGSSFHPACCSGRHGEKSSTSVRSNWKLAVITALQAAISDGPAKISQATPAMTTRAVAKSLDLRILPSSAAFSLRLWRIGGGEAFADDDQHIVAHRREGDGERDDADRKAGGQADREQVERWRGAADHADDEVEAEQQEADGERQQQAGEERIAAEEGDVLQPIGRNPAARRHGLIALHQQLHEHQVPVDRQKQQRQHDREELAERRRRAAVLRIDRRCEADAHRPADDFGGDHRRGERDLQDEPDRGADQGFGKDGQERRDREHLCGRSGMRSNMPTVKSLSSPRIRLPKIMIENATTSSLGTKLSVCSLIDVAAWIMPRMRPASSAGIRIGALARASTHIVWLATVRK